MKTRVLTWLLVAAALLMLEGKVFAQTVPPNRFAGTVTAGGEPVPDGSTVSATIDGVTMGTTTVSGGRYLLDVALGTHVFITFFVDGVPTEETASWEFGGLTTLDLTLTEGVFSDVPTDHFARPFIDALFTAGITTGCDAGPPLLYCPEASVTRGQMAAFLVRAFDLPVVP